MAVATNRTNATAPKSANIEASATGFTRAVRYGTTSPPETNLEAATGRREAFHDGGAEHLHFGARALQRGVLSETTHEVERLVPGVIQHTVVFDLTHGRERDPDLGSSGDAVEARPQDTKYGEGADCPESWRRRSRRGRPPCVFAKNRS